MRRRCYLPSAGSSMSVNASSRPLFGSSPYEYDHPPSSPTAAPVPSRYLVCFLASAFEELEDNLVPLKRLQLAHDATAQSARGDGTRQEEPASGINPKLLSIPQLHKVLVGMAVVPPENQSEDLRGRGGFPRFFPQAIGIEEFVAQRRAQLEGASMEVADHGGEHEHDEHEDVYRKGDDEQQATTPERKEPIYLLFVAHVMEKVRAFDKEHSVPQAGITEEDFKQEKAYLEHLGVTTHDAGLNKLKNAGWRELGDGAKQTVFFDLDNWEVDGARLAEMEQHVVDSK